MPRAHAPTASPLGIPARSTLGVESLIAQATATHEAELLAQAVSPLFPETCPWQSVAAVPAKPGNAGKRLAHQLSAITAAVAGYCSSLTVTAGQLAPFLDASDTDVRELALQFSQYQLPGQQKLAWAARLLGAPVPGDNLPSRMARVADARFWRRAIRLRLMRERENFFLRLRLVGRGAERYVSDAQLSARLSQLRRQAEWMKNTVLVPRYMVPGDAADGLLTLDQVASSPRARFSKLYSFVQAMDAISVEQGLATGMLTLTLEPEWHPNPSHGANSWNGSSPRAAHQSMATRWQSILRDLDRLGVGLSGLRVVEPHQDACPHWHLWLLYRPDAEQQILETVMRYFPHKLKLRAPRAKAGASTAGDVVYDSLDALKARISRAPTHAKEGAQIELARIDRSISSGASYAMKYLLKTVDGGETLNAEAGLFPDGGAGNTAALTPEQVKRRQEHLATAKRVDAYRSLWGINAGQLFGVAKCLTAWDELRRLEHAPTHPLMKQLWALARGTDKSGRIGAGESIRGDARGFLEALGGLAACGKPLNGVARVSIGRLTETAVNAYGEDIERTRGVTLIERRHARVAVGSLIVPATGEIKTRFAWRSVKTVLASIKTRLGEWTLVLREKSVPGKALKPLGEDSRVMSAVHLAEQRLLADADEDSPGNRARLAARAFWSRLWAGVEAMRPDTGPPPTWQLMAL